MFFIYNLKLETKEKWETELSWRPWSATKLFPVPSPKIRENQYRRTDKDGYLIIEFMYQAVYQDNIDLDNYTDKILLKDGGQLVLEAPNKDYFDKIKIVWLKCSCGNSPLYRLTLDYAGVTSYPPQTFKTFPRA